MAVDSRGQQGLGGAAPECVTALPEGASIAHALMRGGGNSRQALYDAAAGGAPLALMGALHPEPITDLAWSRDGRFLAVASYDGYCRRAR
jgi:WD40 repeat protein